MLKTISPIPTQSRQLGFVEKSGQTSADVRRPSWIQPDQMRDCGTMPLCSAAAKGKIAALALLVAWRHPCRLDCSATGQAPLLARPLSRSWQTGPQAASWPHRQPGSAAAGRPSLSRQLKPSGEVFACSARTVERGETNLDQARSCDWGEQCQCIPASPTVARQSGSRSSQRGGSRRIRLSSHWGRGEAERRGSGRRTGRSRHVVAGQGANRWRAEWRC